MKTTAVILFVIMALAVPNAAEATFIAHWEGEGTVVNSLNPGTHDLSGTGGSVGFEAGYGGGQAFSIGVGANPPPSWYATDSHPDLQLGNKTDFTIALWAKLASYDNYIRNYEPNTFISKYDGTHHRHWAFYYAQDSLQFSFTSGSTEQYNTPALSYPINLDEWHHFAVTRSGDDFIFYADGTLLGTVTNSNNIDFTNHPLTIGIMGDDPANSHFSGALDDIRFYSGSTLSTGEIQALAAVVPEPSTLALLGLGVAALAATGRRRSLR